MTPRDTLSDFDRYILRQRSADHGALVAKICPRPCYERVSCCSNRKRVVLRAFSPAIPVSVQNYPDQWRYPLPSNITGLKADASLPPTSAPEMAKHAEHCRTSVDECAT